MWDHINRYAAEATGDDVGRCGSAVGRLWGHLDRYPLRGVVVAQERPGTLGGGLDVVAVRGEAAPAPQAHRTAPYRPRYSLDQRTAGQYLGGLGTPGDGHVPTRLPSTPKEQSSIPLEVQARALLPAWHGQGRPTVLVGCCRTPY